MPTPKKGPRLGGSASHQRHLIANLATALFEHGKITTTEARARALRPVAEKLITKARRGDLHNRREVLKTITDKSVVHVLFTEIGPKMAERPGGYTRITKLAPRKGDNAPMAVIALVQEAYAPAATKTTAKKTTSPAPASEPVEEQPAAVEETPAEETHVGEEAEESAPAAFADLEYGDDVAEPLEDGAAPSADFTIKGNKDSGKYHTPDSQWFDQTVAEVWFRTEAAAEAAGFVKAG